jgi:hypothetical protein
VILVNDKQAKALRDALKEIKQDRDAFKRDPKGKVPDLDDHAVAVFKGMSNDELDSVATVDEKMKEAGFTHDIGGISLRMV